MNGESKKVRLFVALSVPGSVGDKLAALPHKGLDARWSHRDDCHITLRFIGEVPEERIPEIKEALGRVRRDSFDMVLEGLGSFQMGRQTVMWTGVASTRKLTALVAEINEALAPLGFEMPNKPFTPHVTLARLKHPAGVNAYIERHGKSIRAQWRAASFGLYLSASPDEKGRSYSLLQSYTLS